MFAIAFSYLFQPIYVCFHNWNDNCVPLKKTYENIGDIMKMLPTALQR